MRRSHSPGKRHRPTIPGGSISGKIHGFMASGKSKDCAAGVPRPAAFPAFLRRLTGAIPGFPGETPPREREAIAESVTGSLRVTTHDGYRTAAAMRRRPVRPGPASDRSSASMSRHGCRAERPSLTRLPRAGVPPRRWIRTGRRGPSSCPRAHRPDCVSGAADRSASGDTRRSGFQDPGPHLSPAP